MAPQLWSLLDMLRPYAQLYLDSIKLFIELVGVSKNATGKISEKNATGLRERLDEFLTDARLTDLDLTTKGADRLRRELGPDMSMADLAHRLQEVEQRLYDELSSRQFFYVENRNVPYYDEPLKGWDDVPDKFPSVISDIEEAGKCLSLSRATACVFHLMRVMEVGLQRLAKDLGIPYAPSWESYINQINTKVAEKHKKKGIRWKRDEFYFKEIAGDLLTVKVSWRNPTMHIVRSYSPEEAERVFAAVRTLMQRIAERTVSS